MTDYKQLCFELTEALRGYEVTDEDIALIDRARAALAEPKPEGPTDEELCDLMYEFTIGTGHGERLDEIGFARAALARWGNHPGSPDGSTPPS